MGWYKTAISKMAQIWEYKEDPDDSLDNYGEDGGVKTKIKEFYEMEYKLSMLKLRPFSGHPSRKEKIEEKLKESLVNAATEIKTRLYIVFRDWLSSHAITEPKRWATVRVFDQLESSGYDYDKASQDLMFEYSHYQENQNNYSVLDQRKLMKASEQKILNDIFLNIDKYPSVKQFFETYLDEYKENEINEAIQNIEDFNDSHSTSFTTKEEIENWIETNVTLESLSDITFFEDIKSLLNALDKNGYNATDLLIEIYEKNIFPKWYAHWSEQGIDKTRKTIEQIFEKLQAASGDDIGNLSAIVSMGLNATHQTGDMLDYLEQNSGESDLKETLNMIEKGSFVEKANKELREIGVKI